MDFDIGEHFPAFQQAIRAEGTKENWQKVCQLLSEIPREMEDEMGVYLDFAEENLDHWPPEIRKPICRWTFAKEGELQVHRLIPDLEGDYIILASEFEQMAPDPQSIKAAKSIAKPAKWDEYARGRAEFWGVMSGSSGEYYVIANYKARQFDCNCPSRKRPCKHVLALFLMAVNNEVFPRRIMPHGHEDNAKRTRYSSTWE